MAQLFLVCQSVCVTVTLVLSVHTFWYTCAVAPRGKQFQSDWLNTCDWSCDLDIDLWIQDGAYQRAWYVTDRYCSSDEIDLECNTKGKLFPKDHMGKYLAEIYVFCLEEEVVTDFRSLNELEKKRTELLFITNKYTLKIKLIFLCFVEVCIHLIQFVCITSWMEMFSKSL